MSYVVTLECGCDVYMACHPQTGVVHTRIIERHAAGCRVRSHAVGVRLQLWELLPRQTQPAAPTRELLRLGPGVGVS